MVESHECPLRRLGWDLTDRKYDSDVAPKGHVGHSAKMHLTICQQLGHIVRLKRVSGQTVTV